MPQYEKNPFNSPMNTPQPSKWDSTGEIAKKLAEQPSVDRLPSPPPFNPPPAQGPQDYSDNAPHKGPFNNPFGPGPNPPQLGPFPFPNKIPPQQ